jgi:YD repeat-containing protein
LRGNTTQCFQPYHYVNDLSVLDTVTSHLEHKFAFTYDDKGRQTAETAPGGVDIAWVFELEGRVVRREEHAGADTVHRDALWYDARK